MKKYWFKPKQYGYGITPINWQGWLATLALLAVILLSAYANKFFTGVPTFYDVASFLFDLIIVTTLFLVVLRHKTDGEIKWNWGKRK